MVFLCIGQLRKQPLRGNYNLCTVALEHIHVLSPYWTKVTYDEVGAQVHWYIFIC